MATVKDILHKKGAFVAPISKSHTVLAAAKEMNTRRIGALVVTDGDNVVGIFTERDILTRVVAAELDPGKTSVGQVMTSPVACCQLDTTLEECKEVMTRERIRHLPVVEQSELAGIVTSGDLLAHEAAQQKETINGLHQSIEYLHQYLYGAYR